MATFLILLLCAIVVVFSVQNAGLVAISFLTWRFEASLAMVVFLCVLTGVMTGMLIMATYSLRRSARQKKASSPPEKGSSPKGTEHPGM
jgi:uncharacterized integral membrane protein